MNGEFTEKDYRLHIYPYQVSLKVLEEELKKIEESGKKTLWFYSGRETFDRLKKGDVPLTPHDVNNIVYVLLRRLGEK